MVNSVPKIDWREHGVKIIRVDQLDSNTPQTARMRWGEHLEYVADAGPGDFIYVPPFVPHQEINASREEPLSCVLVRSGQEPIVVNLEIVPAEPPEEVYWVDDIHSPPS